MSLLMELEEARKELARVRSEQDMRYTQYLNADPDMEASAWERWQSKARECQALRMHYEALLARMSRDVVQV